MATSDLAIVALILLLLFVSAMFSAAEISLLSLGIRRAKRVSEGLAGRVMARMAAHPAVTLGTILVAITAVKYAAQAIATESVVTHLGWPVWTAVAGMTVLVLVLAEAIPISYATANPERVARSVAVPVWLAYWILFLPSRLIAFIAEHLAYLLGGRPSARPVTEGEIRAIVDLQAEAGGLEAEEKVMIHSIFEFGDKVAREVMVPRTDMVAVPETATVWEAAQATTDHRLSRLPVYRRDLDDIVGVVYVNDLLPLLVNGERRQVVSTVMKPPFRVPETRKLDDLLMDMRRQQRTLAIVVDEYGGTAGLVTLEDLLEEVVGDIWDEYDVIRPMVERRPDGTIELDGRVSVDEASEVLGVDLPEGEYDSVAGLVYSHLGVIPRVGDRVEVAGITLVVQELEGVRITRVLALPAPPAAGEAEGNGVSP